jgi:hypothetical protein
MLNCLLQAFEETDQGMHPSPCRLEQFASGAVFCQMLDAYFNDAIPMHKVLFVASSQAVPCYVGQLISRLHA